MSDSKFEELLQAYTDAAEPETAAKIEQDIWANYGRKLAVVVIDMAGFSSLCLRYGIIHYLALIRQLQRQVRISLNNHHGELLKFEADNVFASFENPLDAISCVVELNSVFNELNAEREEHYRVFLASGIDYGMVLMPEPGEFFGNTVNRASKLGEDLARGGEILISDEVYSEVSESQRPTAEQIDFEVSGISLKAWRLSE
jgi:class 3 adenylate cyclase